MARAVSWAWNKRFVRAFVLTALLSACALAAPSDDDLFFRSAADVSEGELRFLTRLPDKPVHHHRNRVTIREDSIATGWVTLEQCHEHLDPVPSAQIVYSRERIRNIQVVSHERIGQARVEMSSVQLTDIRPGATICIRAETRALTRSGEGSYNLSNGPYMRRFLDGFYPMRVSMTVRLDTDRLRFVEALPEEQPGFHIWARGKEVGYDTVFEGILNTVLRFDLNP